MVPHEAMATPAERVAAPRILVLADDRAHEVFDVLGLDGPIAQVRTPFLFEVGEELAVRIEDAGGVFEAQVRVRAHTGPAHARVTELEILERSERRNLVNG